MVLRPPEDKPAAPTMAQHPLVSTLYWVWTKLNSGRVPDDPLSSTSENERNSSSGSGSGSGSTSNSSSVSASGSGNTPRSSSSGRELGLMWNEEYGGHLDLYAEYVQDLKSHGGTVVDLAPPQSDKVADGKESPFTTRSPGWGWWVPITPPRDSPSLGLPFFDNSHSSPVPAGSRRRAAGAGAGAGAGATREKTSAFSAFSAPAPAPAPAPDSTQPPAPAPSQALSGNKVVFATAVPKSETGHLPSARSFLHLLS